MSDRPNVNIVRHPSIGEPDCLRCGARLNGIQGADAEANASLGDAAHAEDARRAFLEELDGELSICMECGNVAVFVVDRGDLALRPPRLDERVDIAKNESVQRTLGLLGFQPFRVAGRG